MRALPFYSLGMGLIGAAAVATVSSLLALHDVFKPLRYCGRNSIVVYLAFFLPMAATRGLLLKTGVITDIGTISVLVTAAGVIGSLLMFWAVRGTFAEVPVRAAGDVLAGAESQADKPNGHAAGGMTSRHSQPAEIAVHRPPSHALIKPG